MSVFHSGHYGLSCCEEGMLSIRLFHTNLFHTEVSVMKRARIFLWFLVVTSTMFVPLREALSQESAGELYEAGLFKKEADGDLEGAIELFLKVITEYPEDKQTGAKAQLQIGICYEKLRARDALEAYQRVVDNYPEQQREVAIAKEGIARLSEALEEVPHRPNFRKIRIPTKPGNGALSPDGKKLAFVSKGSIWVVPVHGKVSPDIAGEPVRLPGTEGAWTWGMRWSADGKWIAYNTLPSAGHVGICIVPSSGGKVKRIVNRYRAGTCCHNYLLSLSPDGKIVAFTSDDQLFTVNVEGGDVNQLTEDGGTQPAFSPDGKKIAYVKEKPRKTEIRKSDVWVIPAAGGTPVQVSDLPERATGPIWSPDGKMIAFIRKVPLLDISKEICIVPVSETGKPEASPTQIELPLETWDFLAGWTPDNKIGALLANPIHYAIYTVPASGGNATQVTPQGYYFSPRWSPDGKRIYLRGTDGPDGVASVPSEGGEFSISHIDADSMIRQLLQWGGDVVSPDGKKIVFPASKKDNKSRFPTSHIYTIPVKGGEPKQLTVSPGWDRFPCWSPDGKSIAFIRYSDASWNKKKHDYINNICIVRPEGGEVRQLTSESDKVARATIAWSPDGKSIAYYSEDKTIRVIPVKGGESREVVEVDKVDEWWDELAWSRDGKKIAYSSKGSIWVVSLDGGEPEKIKTGLDARVTHISWSPDGKKIAFTASKGGDIELWLMEDFLPVQGE
jgi:Tol biopolymer transport system component